MKIKILFFLAVIALFAGCGTLYTTTVTITQAEDAVMKQWATLHNDGMTGDTLDRQVMDFHAKFNASKLVAAAALRTYEAGGEKANYIRALEAVRAAINPIIDLIAPSLSPTEINALKARALIAKKL